MHDPVHETPIPRLQNIVATFCTLPLGQTTINLELIVTQCPFMEFNSKRFAAVVVRILRPKTTCLLFASGKAVCTGARNESEACTACLKYVNLFCMPGQAFRFMRFKIENIVAAAHCPFRLNLKQISDTVSGWINYEPTLFPGLIYRKVLDGREKSNKRNTLVFICFQSGKCVITGGHSRGQILSEWIGFFDDILKNNVALVDYGSSGNYRVVQDALTDRLKDNDMFNNICYFQRVVGPTTVQNGSELLQLQNNQNARSAYTKCVVDMIMTPVKLCSDDD